MRVAGGADRRWLARENSQCARSSDFRAAPDSLVQGYVDSIAVNAVSVDWSVNRPFIRQVVQSRMAVQGNLDPLALLGRRRCAR